MKPKMEIRTLASKLELRGTSEAPKLEGYAAIFNSLSLDLGGFKERVAPGAFSRALRERHDVRCLMNHNPDTVLGRSTNKTLTLTQDEKGLWFSCLLPDTQAARDLYALVQRRDISQCSFSFQCTQDEWTDETDPEDERNQEKIHVRTVRDLTLFDVSAVTTPAYTATSVSARSKPHYNEAPAPRRVELFSPEEARQLAENRQREAAAKEYSDRVESWRTGPMGNDAGIQEFIRKEKERGR